uniref:Phosphoribosylamine--glycine ligase n=1 Tax=candidate division WOR-3 bacterium TaxID=2052148 RepID=A0A7C3J700_UNCW3
MKRNLFLLGNGGRESALCYKLNRDRALIYSYDPNPTIAGYSIRSPEFSKESFYSDLSKFVEEKDIQMVVIGPEKYLDEGATDFLESKGIKVFGPSKEAAKIETDKSFAKELMKKYNVPTARYEISESLERSMELKRFFNFPFVMKVSGLASGKGALIIKNDDDFEKALDDIYKKNIFKDAAKRVVFEEFLYGDEVSLFILTDGKKFLLLPPAQDHKKVFDNDEGPNTGGMGSYAPCNLLKDKLIDKSVEKIVEPILYALRKEGKPFKGLLYAGLMVNDDEIFVVEFNSRFGDPETQSIIPLIDSSLYDIMVEISYGDLKTQNLKINHFHSTTVVLAAKGYPSDYKKGIRFKIEENIFDQNTILFHASSKEIANNLYENTGGRILNLTSFDTSLEKSINRVYSNIEKLKIEDTFYRHDIGKKGILYEKI